MKDYVLDVQKGPCPICGLEFKSTWGTFYHNSFLSYVSRCKPGLIPLPDSIEGCVECLSDSDCKNGYYCDTYWVGAKSTEMYDSHKCVSKIKPCDPSPCGPWTCMVIDNESVCRFFKMALESLVILHGLPPYQNYYSCFFINPP